MAQERMQRHQRLALVTDLDVVRRKMPIRVNTKPPSHRRPRWHRLIVLASVAVVVGVLGILILQWKRNSEREGCIHNIRNVQQVMRGYMGMNGHNPETQVPEFTKESLIGPGKFMDSEPRCPGGGTYTWIEGRHPAIGVLTLRCSCRDHVPADYSEW